MGKLGVDRLSPVPFTDSEWSDLIQHAERPELTDYMRVRTKLQQKISDLLYEMDFLHPPNYLFSACTDPLNHETEEPAFNYYGQNLSSVQSLIFHKMAIIGLCNIPRVFWISPNIRKERNVKDCARYATEFTQIDFEMANKSMNDAIDTIEYIVKTIFFFSEDLNKYDAVDYAVNQNIDIKEVEKHLSSVEKKPFFITNLKREAYDKRDDDTGKYRNFDLCMPGYGEVLSGGEREWEYDRLKMRMEELNYNLDYFEPILRLAREGKLKPTVGAGFGIERLTRAVCEAGDISNIYPFKRVPEKRIIF